MQFEGIIIGAVTFIMIGLFHPIVIKCEYYFTKRCWPVFLAVGILSVLASLFLPDFISSAIVAIFGITCLWSIGEVREQEQRVKRGWYPMNPKREQGEK